MAKKSPAKASKALSTITSSLKKMLQDKGIVMLSDTETHRFRMEIKSESSNRIYRVSQRMLLSGEDQWECSCPGWIFKRTCKHLNTMKPVLEAMAPSSPTRPINAPKPRLEAKKVTLSSPKKKVAKKKASKKKTTKKQIEL